MLPPHLRITKEEPWEPIYAINDSDDFDLLVLIGNDL